MLTAREKGRDLELIVGGGDDALTFLVAPIPAKQGSALLADWVGIAFGETEGEEAIDAMTNVTRQCLGPVTDEITDLRWAEQEAIINAAFMWNVQGGGIDLVKEYLSGGLPKARERLLKAVGLWDVYSMLLTLPSSESENPTSMDDSPATSTPDGGESSRG